MLEQARMDAERIISDAHQEAIQLEDSIRGLRRIQREAVFKMRSSIEGYLHLLDDAMLPPEELDNLLSSAASDMRAIQGRGGDVEIKEMPTADEIEESFKSNSDTEMNEAEDNPFMDDMTSPEPDINMETDEKDK